MGVIVILVVTVALAAAGCGSSAAPDPGAPLVEIEARGGLCPEGECHSITRITRGGVVAYLGPAGEATTPLDPGTAAALRQAVDSADYRAIAGRPFLGQCPIAVDGQEIVYRFHAPGGVVELSSCEVAIDLASQPFATLEAALRTGRLID